MSDARRTARLGYLHFSIFISGVAVMAAEMAAPRLLAPAFGTSQLIWANIIATVLASLTLGAFIGGWLADRWPHERVYYRVFALAGALLALVPWAARPFLTAASNAMSTQQAASFLLSLLAVCVFFAPPVFLLGMVGPWAVRIAGHGREDLGRVAGRLSGLAALGSILGTFLASLVALPLLGTRRTLLLIAATLIATGAWGAVTRRTRALGSVLAIALAVVPPGPVKRSSGQIFETESFFQYVEVIRDRAGWLHLRLNEGLGSHSIRPARGYQTNGVWDYLAAVPSLVSDPGDELRVLILGLAAGTTAQQIDRFYGKNRVLHIDGVEIDSAVVDAARRYFDLGKIGNLSIHVADARAFLAVATDRYDLIIVDAYQGFYVPFQVATRDFYQQCRQRLSGHGVLAVNLAAPANAWELRAAFDATLAASLPHVARFEVTNRSVPFSNFVYLASEFPLSAPDPSDLPAELASHVGGAIQRSWAEVRGSARGLVLSDDRAPVELLTDAVLLRVLTRRP